MFRQDISEIADFSMGRDDFKDVGCAICSAMLIVEQRKGIFYYPQRLQTICLDLKRLGVIDKNFYVNSWDKLFSFLGLVVTTRFEDKYYVCEEDEEEILKLIKPGFFNDNRFHCDSNRSAISRRASATTSTCLAPMRSIIDWDVPFRKMAISFIWINQCFRLPSWGS